MSTRSTHLSSFWCRTLTSIGLLLSFIIFYSLQSKPSLEDGEVQVKEDNGGESSLANGENSATLRVLCYGDSLTAGMSPPNREFCPYATSLQLALEASSSSRQYEVDHIGLSGRTTDELLQMADEANGLSGDLTSHPSTDVVVLLAGTNDIFRLGAEEGDAKLITQNLIELHKMALSAGVSHTIALAIPPSGHLERRPEAIKMVEQVNSELEEHASLDNRMKFVPFPFQYEKDGNNWSLDRLHLSCNGYDALGRLLASTLLDVLQ